ncbi:unnamed protein product [Prunus brigantina]
MFEVGFNLYRRSIESSTRLGVVDLRKRGSSVTRSSCMRRNGRSKRQASSTSVVLAKGSLMLKSASVMQLPHRRNVSLVVEIMMVSSVFRDSQKCLTFGRLWRFESSKKDSKSPHVFSGEEIKSNNHKDDVGTSGENTESKYLEECPIRENKVVVCAGEGN